jgi:hypothetical protein
MPRGNRKANLSSRLANIQPRGILPPEKIPGTKTWCYLRKEATANIPYDSKKARDSFFSNFTSEELKTYPRCIPRTRSYGTESTNETLIDNINRWIDGNGWQYIDGGEYDGSWVNPRYPNRIFKGTSRSLPVTGGVTETVEFPVANHEEDPLGLACHFKTSIAGTKSTVLPNKWTDFDSTRTGRVQAKNNAKAARRLKRWMEFQEAEKIKNPVSRQNAVHALKAKFLSEDFKTEQVRMDYDDDFDHGIDI